MTALVLLKRSDANLVLVACCEGNGSELAEELSKQQAFTVGVVACLPALGGYVCNVQASLGRESCDKRMVRNGRWRGNSNSKLGF